MYDDIFDDEIPPKDLLQNEVKEPVSEETKEEVPLERLTLKNKKLAMLPCNNELFKVYTADKMLSLWLK